MSIRTISAAIALGALAFGGAAQGRTPQVAVQSRPPATSDLTALGNWAQRISAAQQPALAAYAACQPVTKQAMAAMQTGDAETARALVPQVTQCLADYETAAQQSSTAIAAVGALPRALDARLNIDSGELVRSSAAILKTIAISMQSVRVGIEAAAAGDNATAQQSIAKGRSGIVAAIDAQIMMFEMLGKSMPGKTAHAMFDMRLATSRALRLMLTSNGTPQGIEVGDELRKMAPLMRSAAVRIVSGWAAESVTPRAYIARTKDTRRAAILAQIDAAYRGLAREVSGVADVIDATPAGTISQVEAGRVADSIAQFEIYFVTTSASMAASFSGIQ